MRQAAKEGVPPFLAAVLAETAKSLGRSIDGLDYPNANRGDSPLNEANVIAHFAAALRGVDTGALFYSEAPLAKGQRLDLLAYSNRTTLLVEAKVLGNIGVGCSSLASQVERMRGFEPACSGRVDKRTAGAWWREAETWAVVLIGSHAEISSAWSADGLKNVAGIFAAVEARPRSANKARNNRQALVRLLECLHGWEFGREQVLGKGVFAGTSDLDLLWAALPLSTSRFIASVEAGSRT